MNSIIAALLLTFAREAIMALVVKAEAMFPEAQSGEQKKAAVANWIIEKIESYIPGGDVPWLTDAQERAAVGYAIDRAVELAKLAELI